MGVDLSRSTVSVRVERSRDTHRSARPHGVSTSLDTNGIDNAACPLPAETCRRYPSLSLISSSIPASSTRTRPCSSEITPDSPQLLSWQLLCSRQIGKEPCRERVFQYGYIS